MLVSFYAKSMEEGFCDRRVGFAADAVVMVEQSKDNRECAVYFSKESGLKPVVLASPALEVIAAVCSAMSKNG